MYMVTREMHNYRYISGDGTDSACAPKGDKNGVLGSVHPIFVISFSIA